MKVFNTCLKVVKRRAAVLLVYFVIFVALAVALSSFSAKQQNDVFHPSEISIAVVNDCLLYTSRCV